MENFETNNKIFLRTSFSSSIYTLDGKLKFDLKFRVFAQIMRFLIFLDRKLTIDIFFVGIKIILSKFYDVVVQFFSLFHNLLLFLDGHFLYLLLHSTLPTLLLLELLRGILVAIWRMQRMGILQPYTIIQSL